MLVWFIVIAALGLSGIVGAPVVLTAVNPWFGLRFLLHSGPAGPLILGGVFLCITGGEALYADMGHFGRGPIRLSWYGVVLPALLISYAGQTALLLRRGHVQGQSLLRAGASLGDLSPGGPLDGRDDHRQPVHHHRLLLHDPAGHAAGVDAGGAHPPDLGPGLRPDLRSGG